jgi:predicted acyltransferase
LNTYVKHSHLKQELQQLPKRLLSIDVFRAITMLLMIFVNDASSVHGLPSWLDHAEVNEDRLGFADTIFPTFLFIAGLSLPLAIRNRKSKGDSFLAIIWYILLRSVALLIMGFFHVNIDNYSRAAILPEEVWVLLVTCGFFLIWLDYPSRLSRLKKYSLISSGVLLLVLMAWLYKGGAPENPESLDPSWWGILGIIGWAYLACAIIYLLVNGSFPLLLVALALLIGINVTAHMGLLHAEIPVIGDASSATLVMSGIVVSVLYAKLVETGTTQRLWGILTGAAILMLLSGFLVRPHAGGISKIYATPAWVLICTGISLLVFEATIWLVDVKGKQNLFKFIRPAGSSTLTCYLIPYFLYSIMWLTECYFPPFFNKGWGGLLRCLLFALLVITITGLLEKRRIRLKI